MIHITIKFKISLLIFLNKILNKFSSENIIEDLNNQTKLKKE